ncbi:MAG TPA: response regulator transcription factor [Burkholderiales bacterium]|nr:response regulator transcription factor [Burkholderiales bacterium]
MQVAASEPRTHVFIVEDSESIRQRLAGMLGDMEGVTVVGEAETPREAVEGILRTRPDSVVLDLHLVGGSGLDVLRRAHPQTPDTVFIVLTNHPNAQYRRACMEAGAAYFFDKSHEIAKVREVIAGLGATRH